ncbi:sugar transporter SWEET1-like [Tubulanus polymorphus]|uniref:sugar transporter SWEET1-like n=1 Tax=Tubulanus polymorphus TaxID=672921 RepID=UPI003DA3DA87
MDIFDDEARLLEIVGRATQISTILMNVTGVPMVYGMLSKNDTRHVPYHFFILGFIVNSIFLAYGLSVGDFTLNLTSGFGLIMNTFYLSSYLYAVQHKTTVLTLLFVAAGFLAGLYGYVNFVVHPSLRHEKVGFIGCIMTMMMQVSPLIQVKEFVRAESCAGMSKLMVFGGIFCASSWFAYGKLINDFYVYSPNVPGLAVSAVQIALLLIYGDAKKTKEKMK